MEEVRPLCGQPSDRGRLWNRTEQRNRISIKNSNQVIIKMQLRFVRVWHLPAYQPFDLPVNVTNVENYLTCEML